MALLVQGFGGKSFTLKSYSDLREGDTSGAVIVWSRQEGWKKNVRNTERIKTGTWNVRTLTPGKWKTLNKRL